MLFLFSVNPKSYSQSHSPKFEQISIDDGLSQSTVRCIFQDRKGFMWFGTKDGLNRYDGYKFTIYRKNPLNENSLASNDIKSIVDDKEGNLWIATWDGGLNCYDPKADKFTRYLKKNGTNSIASNFLESLCRDDNDNIWIGTADNGLDYFNTKTKQFTNYNFGKSDFGSISSNSISAIFEDSKKTIWVGTTDGLNMYDKKTNTFKRFVNNPKDPRSISDNHIKFIYEDKNHHLWVGTYGGGLNELDLSTGDFRNYKKANSKLSSDALIGIAADYQGNLWIGTENGGLNIFDPIKRSFTVFNNIYNDATSISSNTINAIVKDTKGNMWLGTLNGGINLLQRDNENFAHYKHEQGTNSLVNNIVNCIYEDSKLNLWIGTDGGGVDLFDRKTKHFQNLRHEKGNTNSLSGDYILSVCEDKDGNIWIGSWGEGISVYNPISKTLRFFKNDIANPGSLNSNYAFYIFKDSQSRMWVGTYGGGVDLYDAATNKFIHHIHNDKIAESISSNNILTINEDDNHNILIGTDGAGLSVLNPNTGKCTFYKDLESKNGLSNNSISSIYQDKKNNIWLSTNDGLDEVDEITGKVTCYFMENGLPSNLVASVLGDNKNNIWVATDNGLSKFNLNNKSIKNYNRSDGLQANEFKYSRCLSKTGQMYFGGINGFNEFRPDSIADLSFDPPIIFTDFEIFNKHVDISQDTKKGYPLNVSLPYNPEIELSYKQSVITFEFASLNYVNKEKKQYAYILQGFDNQWHYLGTKNNVTYTNLDPGSYTLKVKGLNNTGTFSTKVSQIQITVNPPFWKTWWFEGLMIILIVAIVIGIFYIRVRSIKIQNKILEAKVTRRTQELKEANLILTENNNQIRIQNEKLEIYNKEIVDKSNKILDQQEHIIIQNTKLEHTVSELEKSNQTKNRFLSILAHDLRNPITAIAGIAKNLKMQMPQVTKQEIGKYISIISDSSKSVLDLLLNLLEWAKTQNETLTSNPESVNLHELVISNQVLMEQLLRNKNIYLTINVPQYHILFADKKMIDTVLRNLLSNSIKFTPPFGQISIESKEINNKIIITFYDTGLGMTDEQVSNLFNIETAASSPGSNGEPGSGLGMVIIKEFVEANHGSVTVASKVNEGSIFTIQLPKGDSPSSLGEFDNTGVANTIAYEDSTGEKVNDQKRLKLQGKRLLFIDDNADIRAYLKLILSSTFEIMEAENGREGIKAAIDFQPDIIITDMLMPVMNGLEFCKTIKLNPLTSHIPVILLTSQTDSDSQLQGYEAGVDAYLVKPLNQQILHQVIYNLIISTINSRSKFISSEHIYPDNLTYNARDKDFLDKIIAYIEQNIAQPNLDHKKISEVAAMSRTILYAKIKSLTGQGVHEFIQSIRVKKGLQLLMEGRLNINQVSYEIGFNTPSYFSKCFLKQFGASPKDYLSRLQKLSNE
ncbi:hybrid sensor histidine kinase/response regulator transcription factor [Mucilaginibacter sp. L196]|uniref:hybrid sensor histidine kinase/response regulator transcription factor n=1 Tax=Mucilaginibacter sp. L196 TaxID=1641870 RepID=UPI00131E77BF|nr:hybrid sensor histidine kinase/response regulator transcription factor [Mucilaginibacter sp. L196]